MEIPFVSWTIIHLKMKYLKKETFIKKGLFWFFLQNYDDIFIKKGTLTQVFSCEFCKISQSTFSYKTLQDNCLYNVSWKHQKTSDFLMHLKKYRKRPVSWNGLKILLINVSAKCWYLRLFHNRACFLTVDLHWVFQCTQEV